MTKSPEVSPWKAHSIEAEQELLGALLINNAALQFVEGILEPAHFYEPLHAEIFTVIRQLVGKGKVANPVTLRAFLPTGLEIAPNPDPTDPHKPGLTMAQYLARLAASATTIINAADYAEVIRDLHARRVMQEVGYELCAEKPAETLTLAAQSIDVLDTIISGYAGNRNRIVSLKEAVIGAVDAAALAFQSDGALRGLSWGLSDLDRKTYGMNPGDLIVIAGRPGMGKTALLLSMARALGHANQPGTIYSLEMEAVPLMQRMIADELYDSSPLAYTSMLAGKFEEVFFGRITDAGNRLAELPIMIDQQPAMTFSQIAARTRRAVRSRKIKWIAVDHLHLMKKSGNYGGNAVLEIGEITSGLKALAKELGIVVVLLCQLNRQVEGREDKRPNLSDLRFSGDIEQDADIVAMLYREAYYEQRKEPDARPDSEEYAAWQVRMQRCYNKLDIIIEKQRQGSTGTVRVHCNIGCNAVRNLADDIPGGRT